MTIDVGTGDGRAVLTAAARGPRTLSIGVDADAASLAEASARAARSARKGGQPNVLFLVMAAESMSPALAGLASLVTIRFPWGSLLRGCLGGDEAVAAGVASLLAPDGELELLLAPAERDRLGDLPTEPAAVIAAVAGAFERHGLRVVEAREATAAEIRGSGSTWAKRLLSGPRRGGKGLDRTVILARLRSSGR